MAKQFEQEILMCTVLYRLIEIEERIPIHTQGTQYEFIDDILREMNQNKVIKKASDNTHWVHTDHGIEIRNKLVAIFDQALQFEIFANVNLGLELTEDMCIDGGLVYNDCYDLRFDEPLSDEEAEEWGTEDLRLAAIDYVSQACQQPVDLRRVVFLQMLAEGMLKDDRIWTELQAGTPFSQIKDIVESACSWQELAEDENEALPIMQTIYAAGMIESYKQQCRRCDKCDLPLAMFDLEAKEKKSQLLHCPNEECGAELPLDSSNIDGYIDFFDPKARCKSISTLAEPLF